jgi:hypothetical protein
MVAKWLVPACFGYDVCGKPCGDGRLCLACGPCGRDAKGNCIATDACGQCGGDGSSCKGCDGVAYSGKTYDECGVCGGDGSSCRGCDGVANSGAKVDRCGVCAGGNRDVDACGCCPPTSPLCYLKAGAASALCPPVCNADNSTCTGCDNQLHSGKAVDACGKCGGNNLCKFEQRTFVIGGRRAAAGAAAANETDGGDLEADDPLWEEAPVESGAAGPRCRLPWGLYGVLAALWGLLVWL